MNTSFGALVRHRRRSLGLTQDQLARRAAAQGTTIDVPTMEMGQTSMHERSTLEALATALEWNVGILVVVSGLSSTSPSDPLTPFRHDAKVTYLRAVDQIEMVREEVAGLRDLHKVLQIWRSELAQRVQSLSSTTNRQQDTDA